jgi:hypothetical protein
MLTEHFARWEFTLSNTGVRVGIANVPTEAHWLHLEALAQNVLEPARAALGPIRINSGYRSPALNTLVGGKRGSQHMRGEAADIVPHQCSLGDLFRWIRLHTPFDQLIWEFGSWVHVSHVLAGPQRGTVLLAHVSQGKTVYAPLDEEQITLL